MATDYRDCLADLLRELDHATHYDYQRELKNRARALLDQPEQVAHQDKLDRLIALDRDEPDRWATNAQ